jgi:hypothetical protein
VCPRSAQADNAHRCRRAATGQGEDRIGAHAAPLSAIAASGEQLA